MSIEAVRAYLSTLGLEDRIQEFDVSSATVELAAAALHTEPARIAKTMTFADKDGGCIIVVTAGDTKIQNGAFKEKFGQKAKMLSYEEALAFTGHAVGGICPFALPDTGCRVYMDESLLRFDVVYPAAGTANSAVALTPDELFRAGNALEWVNVCTLREPAPTV